MQAIQCIALPNIYVCSHPCAHVYKSSDTLCALWIVTCSFLTQITISYRTSKKDSQVIINNIDPKPSKFSLHEDPTR